MALGHDHQHTDSCSHEAHDHDHSHDHDGEEGKGDSLYSKIDMQNVTVLNSENAGSDAIKPWHERMDNERAIESDADDQLILKVPFTGSIKLRSILLRSGPGDQTPSKLVLFANNDGLDFDDAANAKSDQEFEIVQSSEIGEYAVKPARFSNLRSITLFVPASQGADKTRISYIGFKGEFTELKDQPVITVYEAQANPADHEKIQGMDGAMSRPGM
ncbi:DUF1000-domain-containing protein [Clavulina sp. PMI_390]|nr:DUF1000-domain-containing protein [Clavulina sp. PMI_390]